MQQVLLLLPRGFEWLEAAAFIDVFGWNMLLGDKQTMLTLAGSEPIVAASFGGGISPDLLLADIDPNRFCALALPGGFSRHGYFRSAQNPQIHELIRTFARLDKPIAAVCTGALVLARAGILQGKKATTYPIAEGYYQRELEQLGACYLNQPLVRDGHILTAQNPAAAMPAALSLLALLTNLANAEAIAAAIGFHSAGKSVIK